MNKPTVAAIALCASAVLSAFVWVQRSSSPPQANPRSTWFSVLQAPPRPLVPQRGATGAALEVEAIAAEVGEGTGTGTEGEVQGDPTPETGSTDATDAYRQALTAAQTAWRLTRTARSPQDWQTVAQAWIMATNQMQRIERDDPRWFFAQKKAREYLNSATYAMARAERSPNRSPQWTFGSSILDEKLVLYTAYIAAEGVPDCLIVGSSRAQQGIDPAVIEAEFQQRGQSFRCFNLSVNGATAQVVDRLIREILPAEQLPKFIIWGDGVRAFNSGRPDHTDELIRTSPGYLALQTDDLQPDPLDLNAISAIRSDGFLAIEEQFDPAVYYETRNRVAGLYDLDYANFSLGGVQTVARDRFLNFAKNRQIPVILVNLPATEEYFDATRLPAEQQFQTQLTQLAQRDTNVTVIDLGGWEGRRPNREFQDPSHLNRYGATYVSQQVVRQLDAELLKILGRNLNGNLNGNLSHHSDTQATTHASSPSLNPRTDRAPRQP